MPEHVRMKSSLATVIVVLTEITAACSYMIYTGLCDNKIKGPVLLFLVKKKTIFKQSYVLVIFNRSTARGANAHL